MMITPRKESRITVNVSDYGFTAGSSYASKAKEGIQNNNMNKPTVFEDIEGMAELPFERVDDTFKTRQIALKVDESKWDKKKDGTSFPVHKIYVTDKIAVQMNFVTFHFEEDIVKYLQKFDSTKKNKWFQIQSKKWTKK